MPVGILALTRLGVVTPQQLRKNRRYAILVLAIVAAVATPSPDPVTMLLALGPLVALFEGSILFASLAHRRRRRRDDQDPALGDPDQLVEDPGERDHHDPHED
jgi:sec-independent protein translocase protein TatC